MTKYWNYKLLLIVLFSSTIFLLKSCSTSGVIIENDIIRNSKRVRAEFNYDYSVERNSPLVTLNQKIVKEIQSDSKSVYNVYDIVKLKTNSFDLDKKVFIIVDNEPFQVNAKFIDSEITSSISEEREDILTSDSTQVSVITGYNKSQSRDYRVTYLIENEVVEKIKSSENVMLRYYAGPDMITIKIRNFNLYNLKKIIEAN